MHCADREYLEHLYALYSLPSSTRARHLPGHSSRSGTQAGLSHPARQTLAALGLGFGRSLAPGACALHQALLPGRCAACLCEKPCVQPRRQGAHCAERVNTSSAKLSTLLALCGAPAPPGECGPRRLERTQAQQHPRTAPPERPCRASDHTPCPGCACQAHFEHGHTVAATAAGYVTGRLVPWLRTQEPK